MLSISLLLVTPLYATAAQDPVPIPEPVPVPVPAEDPIPEDVDPVTTESGLVYSVLVRGENEGLFPKLTDTVTVHYTGWLPDGTVFDSSRAREEPATFKVGGVIDGWKEGLALMRPGDRYKLTIPWNLAYGEGGNGPIPPKSDLIFDVEMIAVEVGPPLPVFRPLDEELAQKTESGLVYQIVREGQGEPAGAEELVTLSFAFWDENGRLIDCTDCSGQRLTFMAQGMDLAFLQEVPLLLPEGSSAFFRVPPELAFGEQPQGGLAANSVTYWSIEMQHIWRARAVPEFSPLNEEKTVTTESGLMYEVLQEGQGRALDRGDVVYAHYAGWLTDGTPFDDSFARGMPLMIERGGLRVGVGMVIPGWDEGLLLMKEGGIYKFHIPYALAYGEDGSPPRIPAQSDLVFIVELLVVL